MSMNQVYLIVRRSFDFYHSKQTTFHHGAAVLEAHKQGMERAFKYWEDIFTCSWAELRRQISQVTMQFNLSCLPDGIILHSDQVRFPHTCWLLPIDDDDILDIRIISKIRNRPINHTVLHWPVNTIDINKIDTTESFAANSYAISSEHAQKETGWAILQRHCFAETTAKHSIIADAPLGLKITHPASIGMLKLYSNDKDCRSAIDKFLNVPYTGLYREVLRNVKGCFTRNLR